MASPAVSMSNSPSFRSCGSYCRARSGNLPLQGTWTTSVLKGLRQGASSTIKLTGLESCQAISTGHSQRNHVQTMCAAVSVASAAGVVVAGRRGRARGGARQRTMQRGAETTQGRETGIKDAAEIPPILVVNLDRSPQRWASCTPQFEEAGVQVTRFSATDGKAMQAAEVRECSTASGNYLCTRGMIGCFLSHRRIWQHVVEEHLPAAVVFEDDVRICPDLTGRLQGLLAELPSDWDVCLLGAFACMNADVEPWYMKFYSFMTGGGRPSPGRTRRVSPGVFVPHRPTGTHAYIVSSRGAKKLLDLLPKARYHVDLSAWALPELRLYAATPFLATQNFKEVSTVAKEKSMTSRFLRWCWTMVGFSKMIEQGGVPDIGWAWKCAMFAFPLPFSNGRRVAITMGPMSAFWVLIVCLAVGYRSRPLLSFSVFYQCAVCALIRYLCGTWSWRFVFGYLCVAAAILYL